MRKWILIAAGALSGAIGGAVIVLGLASVVYDPPAGSWDFATPLLILLAGGIAALIGGIMGGIAGAAADQSGIRRAAAIFGGSMLAIAVLFLAAWAALWIVVRMPRQPPDAGDREKWASTRGTLEPTFGRSLAGNLLTCFAMNRALQAAGLTHGACGHHNRDRIGVQESGYDIGDDGWRWDSVKTAYGYKVVVQPDPLLKQAGPLFEFGAEGLLVRRASGEVPGFAIVPPLGLVESYRTCLLDRIRAADERHEWNGGWQTAVELASEPGSCPGLTISRESRTKEGWYNLTLTAPEDRRIQVTYRSAPYIPPNGFELRVSDTIRKYMLDSAGRWHVAVGVSWAGSENPPPEACELDARVSCPGDMEMTARAAQKAAYERIATRIRFALSPPPRERVILRFDPATMPGLERVVQRDLQDARILAFPYGPVENFETVLGEATAYIWLPGPAALTPPDQRAALARWTDRGGSRREIHVHWSDGTLDVDGAPAPHATDIDEMYLAAIETNILDLIKLADRAVAALSSGEVRVTTPAGTDLRFRVGDRPFNRQTAEGSTARAERARVRVDRHIELPAGVLRVAPLESTVNGVMVLPSFRITDGVRAEGVRLEFTAGRITLATARQGQEALDAYLASAPALSHFREFCLGLNPKLAMRPGDRLVPYYGYGAGVVRLSLGDNEELGGTVRGGAVRWNFFTDATVIVEGVASRIVTDGLLTLR
jgi:hypothetical protein